MKAHKILIPLILSFTMAMLIIIWANTGDRVSIDTKAEYKYQTIDNNRHVIQIVKEDKQPIITQAEVEAEDNFHSGISCDWSSEDSYLLAKIAMAEAESEDIEGKALVMMVVLNRMLDDKFPNTIEEVIYQERDGIYQFTPISNGRFDNIEPNEECWQALELIMIDKWDESQGALYFESCPNEDNWHSRNLEYLFKHGCHRFYK